MAYPTGESDADVPRLKFDHRLKFECHGSTGTARRSRPATDCWLLANLYDALGPTEIAGPCRTDNTDGKNGGHGLTGPQRQSTFG